MRRRAPDFRRPVRRGLVSWICRLLLILSAVVALIFFLPFHRNNSVSDPRSDNGGPGAGRDLSSATSLAHQLVDQMILAKAYQVVVEDQGSLKLAEDLASQIRKSQRLLSQAAVGERGVTLEEAQPVLSNLALLILEAQTSHFDIAANLVKLRDRIRAMEAQINAETLRTAEFSRLISESFPEFIHCLTVKLAMAESGIQKPMSGDIQARILDRELDHFCIFSDNILATSVVVNSTVSNSARPEKFVFHVVTDSANFRAMAAWFKMNNYRGCAVEVRRVEEFPGMKNLSGSSMRYLRFYIPEMFPFLEKIVFLDDDVVVQRDLRPLFDLDLRGNVNGAVETCLDGFHRFNRYFNFSNAEVTSKFDPRACGWSFGVNVFDLAAWRKANLTAIYRYWTERNSNGEVWKSRGTLAPGLLMFHGRTEPLDRRWHLLGLGFDPDIDSQLIDSAAVVHFSGRMKPWLEMSIARYRPLWERYFDHSNPNLRSCLSQSL